MSKRKFEPKQPAVCLTETSKKPPVYRKKEKKTDTTEIDNQFFIAIDGEGVNDLTVAVPCSENHKLIAGKCNCKSLCSKYQRYVLLCASTGEKIYNSKGLSTGECLGFLLDLAIKYPRGIFIIFGGGYDATMWMRDLTYSQLKEVYEYKNVPNKHTVKIPKTSVYTIDGKSYVYGIDYLPRKYMSIVRFEVMIEPNKKKYFVYKRDTRGKKIRHGAMTIWDTWGFFQSKFVSAVAEYGLLENVKDAQFLANMKDARNQFDRLEIKTITEYCFMEVRLLCQLMDKVKGYIGELGLKMTRWDGAGAVSSALMNYHDIKLAKGKDIPEGPALACLHALSGGRIELIQYGHSGQPIYDADINSAYPYELSKLPNMNGYWKESKSIESGWSLIHIKWDLSSKRARFFPFFYRDEDGCISYPTSGENWVHKPEYDAYLKNREIYEGTVEILEVWNFFPDDPDARPFDFIPDLAAKRLIWKKQYKESGRKEGGQHQMAKTGMNGIFGKTIQNVGMYTDTDGKIHNPPFFNLFWAGRVTAGTRAKVFDTACLDPASVVMFSTDGVFTTKKREVPYSNTLGEWELSSTPHMTFVQSGVYYSTDIEKTRGFEKGAITEASILEKWEKKIWKAEGSSQSFITFGMIATAQQDVTIEISQKRLANWEVRTRELHLTPNGTKREYDPKRNPLQKGGPNPSKRLIPTIPKGNPSALISYPYELHMEYTREQDELQERMQTQL